MQYTTQLNLKGIIMANLNDNPKHVAAVEKAVKAATKAANKNALDAIKAVALPEDKAQAKAVKAALKDVAAAIKAG